MKFDQELYGYVLNAAKSFEESLGSRPVTPSEDAVRALDRFDEPLSEDGIDAQSVIKMLHEVGEPGVVSSRGGRYYGFVTGGAMPISVAANWTAALWDQNAGPSVMSPTAAKLEEVAGAWVLDLLSLPSQSGFGFVTGATMAGFTALSSARLRLYKILDMILKLMVFAMHRKSALSCRKKSIRLIYMPCNIWDTVKTNLNLFPATHKVVLM